MIRVQDLTKHYDGGMVKALNGISFDLSKGGLTALMGPSGCGKSTLLHLLGAIDTPTSGDIFLDDRPLMSYQPLDHFRATMVGFVFQFHHLIPTLTLTENVEIPMYPLRLGRKERRRKAVDLLASVGLESRKDFVPTKVSGGERQRAAIARALANDPPVILADEPTGSIDSEAGERVLDLLLGLCRDRAVTILVATHNQEVAKRADRIIRMRDGLLAGLSGKKEHSDCRQ
jgi:putative ABC transport system ATP-binding protein